MAKVAVIGAGVIGLSSARCIQMSSDTVLVTIFADTFHPHTTSDGALGFWTPHCVGEDYRVKKWGSDTYKHMEKLAHSPEASVTGSYTVQGVTLFKTQAEDPFWKDVVAGFRHMTKSELNYYPTYHYGWTYTTMTTECKHYLPWLMDKFVEAGGKVIEKKIRPFEELCDYDVIVNCTGLGARDLTNDRELQPIRGQVLRVSAPWLRHFTLSKKEGVSILRGKDFVVLGGTRDAGEWSLASSLEERKRIWEGCCRLEPSLKAAKVLGEWVGLRPGRPSVRLEQETLRTAQGIPYQVIHNYGHGGAGVTLHWGCALEVTRMVIECLQASNKIKQTSKL